MQEHPPEWVYWLYIWILWGKFYSSHRDYVEESLSVSDERYSAAAKLLEILASSKGVLPILFKESNSAYNVSATFILKGNLKTKILNEAFTKLIERHEILRTYFITSNNGEPEQRILSAEEFSFIIDYKDRKKYERAHIIEAIVALRNKSFDLEKPLLFNAELIGLDNDQYFFYFGNAPHCMWWMVDANYN